ncbi:hypothetical protein SAY87_023886 [Trapa incisa]|uniref:Uncharacterized protein n=1 Tax=Trapa incisa TaxID=236973 RepID=A0AAN7QU74_9MYRT|nr:hypothetical protein SAY87_023886 [Trapa incisa]
MDDPTSETAASGAVGGFRLQRPVSPEETTYRLESLLPTPTLPFPHLQRHLPMGTLVEKRFDFVTFHSSHPPPLAISGLESDLRLLSLRSVRMSKRGSSVSSSPGDESSTSSSQVHQEEEEEEEEANDWGGIEP